VMVSYPAVKMVFSWYAYHYYSYIAEYGMLAPVPWLLYFGSFIVFQIIFNFLLLVLSRGWGISRANLKSDKYYIFSILASMFIIMMFRYLYSASNQILALMIALGLIGFRVTIVVYVFMGINHTIRQLETAMFNYNIDLQNLNLHYVLIKRHKIYVLWKVIFITWLFLNAGAFFTYLMILDGDNDHWVDLMNTEFLDFILFAMISCNFRLRSSPNLFLSDIAQRPNSDGNDNVTVNFANVNANTDTIHNSIEMVSFITSNSASIDATLPTPSVSSDDTNETVENNEGEEDEIVLINKHR
jgi:hypothetical protein